MIENGNAAVRPKDGDPQTAIRLARARRLQAALDARTEAFGTLASIFGDPGFDILLMIYIRTAEGRKTAISASVTAGNAAPTTGLRWLNLLLGKGMVERHPDQRDARRCFIDLSESGRVLMEGFLDMVDL